MTYKETKEERFIRVVTKTDHYKKATVPPSFTTEFSITLISKPVIRLIQSLKPTIFYLDATGSLVDVICCPEKKDHHESRILHHIAVIRDKDFETTIPIFEFISSMSNTDSICSVERFSNYFRGK